MLIIAGKNIILELGHMLKNRYTTYSLRMGVCKIIIRPSVTFGAESRTIRNKMERTLTKWKKQIRREVYENGCWRIKVNQEIYNTFKSPDIVTAIKIRRLARLEHVVRTDGERTA